MSEKPDAARAASRAKVSTGIPGLDEVLGGGLRERRMYLLLGDPGVGKTTMALQFLAEGRRRGERCLYATLSETREELEDIAASHGLSLDGIDIVELHAGEEGMGSVQTMFHPAEVDLEEFTAPLFAALERNAHGRVVVDSLSEMRILAHEPRRFRRQIMALKERFARLGVTALLIDNRTPESAEIVPMTFAHGVIVLQAVAREYGAPRRRLSVPKLRGARIVEGFHDVRIVTGGLVVYPRLGPGKRVDRLPEQVTSSGIPELDAMLGGGLKHGTSALIAGPTGAGKSVLVTQYVHAAASRGEGAAVFLFDEILGVFLARAAGAGLDLVPFIEQGLVRVVQVDPAEMGPGQFASAVCASVAEGRGRLVAIDGINGYLSSVPEEEFLQLHLHELLTHLAHLGATTLLTLSQHGITGPLIEGDVDVSYLTDAMIILRFFEASGEMRKAISVPKLRSGLHELTLREYRIGRTGFRVGEPLRDFQGVLTGTPTYVGPHEPLLREEGHAAAP
jgi:circadian clock protein KaiC